MNERTKVRVRGTGYWKTVFIRNEMLEVNVFVLRQYGFEVKVYG